MAATKLSKFEVKVAKQAARIEALCNRIARIKGRLARSLTRYEKLIEICEEESKGWRKSASGKKNATGPASLDEAIKSALARKAPAAKQASEPEAAPAKRAAKKAEAAPAKKAPAKVKVRRKASK